MLSHKLLGLVAGLLIAPAAWGQAPPPVPAQLAPAPAAPTSNLWSFLCPTPDQKLACKTCLCNSPLGQMLSGAAGPASAMSGGLLPNCCQQTSLANDLKKPADSPDGMAARAKKDSEEVAARRQAVRYLGTLDCNYWPDAVDVLISSLRGDRSECVRFEAAFALQSGCCCNVKVMKALTICVSGGTDDGFPSEHSDRVRAAAADALSHCVLPATPAPPEGDKEQRNTLAPAPTDPAAFYKNVAQQSRAEVVESARAALAQIPQPVDAKQQSAFAYPVSNQQRRPGSLANIFSNAFGLESQSVVASAAPAPSKAPASAQASAPTMPGAPVSINNPVAGAPTAAVQQQPTAVSSAPRKQSLYSIMSGSLNRPQESAPASAPAVSNPYPTLPSNTVPTSATTVSRPVEVSNPYPSLPNPASQPIEVSNPYPARSNGNPVPSSPSNNGDIPPAPMPRVIPVIPPVPVN